MATQENYVVDQGSTFEVIVEARYNNELINLTNMTPQSQMRKSYYTKTYIELNVQVHGNPVDGLVKLTIPPSVSNSARAGRYVYDIEVHDDSGEHAVRILQGIITVSPQVTKTAQGV